MTSNLLFVASLIPAAIGPFWGVYVGKRYRKWGMVQEMGLALAVAPPFAVSIACGVASVLMK